MDEIQKPDNCPHGYPLKWRRHCRECEHEDEIAELQSIISQQAAEIAAYREVLEGAKKVLDQFRKE